MSRCWCLLGGVLLLAAPSRAAEQSTRIQGTVVDASDAAVANATVVLTDPLGIIRLVIDQQDIDG